jgi:hypothetical protein
MRQENNFYGYCTHETLYDLQNTLITSQRLPSKALLYVSFFYFHFTYYRRKYCNNKVDPTLLADKLVQEPETEKSVPQKLLDSGSDIAAEHLTTLTDVSHFCFL